MNMHQVKVIKPPSDRMKFLRALRLIGNLGLHPAVELANYLDNYRNSIVAAGLELSVAAHIADELRSAGAEVSIEPCSIDTPMLCYPAANQKFAWSIFRRIKETA